MHYIHFAFEAICGSLPPGKHRLKCPSCGQEHDSKKNLGITIAADGQAVWHCFKCEQSGSLRPARSSTRTRPVISKSIAPTDEIFLSLSDFGRKLWADTEPLPGTDGEAYLRSRGCHLPPENSDLRFYRKLRHPVSGFTGPALVALVSHAVTGQPLTLHRTWICSDGSKPSKASPARMLLGRHRKAGGVIRLWPDSAVIERLGIAEGIESALSLAHAWRPVWSALDAGNLAKMPVIRRVSELMISADNDPAGIAAARECAARWSADGIRVRIAVPPVPGADLNDVVREVA